MKESKNSKAIGIDEIHPLRLKKSNSKTVRYYLMKLFNKIYKEGIFPDKFDSCKLTPIIKDFNKLNKDLDSAYFDFQLNSTTF
jgi:hypothetical protein